MALVPLIWRSWLGMVLCVSGDDQRFREYVAALVERERRLAGRSLQEICQALQGAFPAMALEALACVPGDWPEGRQVSRTTLDLQMPEPHPIDHDWRFEAPSAEALADQVAAEGRVLCLGTPSVFAAIAARGGRAHLVDRNPFVVRHLPHSERCSFEISDVATMEPAGEPFRAAVLDPPWYLHCYDLFISRAVARLARPGILLVTLFRELTRPGALRERSDLLARLEKLGRTSILDREVIYATPRFEEEVLRRLGLPALPAWRAADVVRVEVDKDGRWDVSPPRHNVGPTWHRFLVGDQVVAVMNRPADDMPICYKAPNVFGHGFALQSVSRRDPARADITVWTSRNHAAVASGTIRIAALLAEVTPEARTRSSLGATLTEDDRRAFARLATDLDIPFIRRADA